MCALFEDSEVVDAAKPFPDFGKLRGKESAEKRADAHVCKIVAAAPNRRPSARIISVRRMIECLFHEPGEGLRAVVADCFLDELDKLGLQSENVQRPTPNVQ